MPELRIALIILGLLVLAAIYYFGSRQIRKENHRRPHLRSPRYIDEPVMIDEKISHGEREEIELQGSFHAREEDYYEEPIPGLSPDPEEARPVKTYDQQPKSDKSSVAQTPIMEEPKKEMTSAATVESVTPNSVPKGKELLVVLCLTSPEGTSFKGPLIRSAVESVGMFYGPKNVFHHFGTGENRSKQSIFFLANMFEPGSFDLTQISTLQTTGLVLILQLPVEINGIVAFDLFVHTAERLASKLRAELRDDKRQILTQQRIEYLRRQVVNACA